MQPRFATGTDEATVTPALTPLLSTSGGRWTLALEGQALERSFKFKTFAKTWVIHFAPLLAALLMNILTGTQDFMTAVSLQCKVKNHHPEWSNVPLAPFTSLASVSPD